MQIIQVAMWFGFGAFFALTIEAIIIISITSAVSHEWKKAFHRIWDTKTNCRVTRGEKNRQRNPIKTNTHRNPNKTNKT